MFDDHTRAVAVVRRITYIGWGTHLWQLEGACCLVTPNMLNPDLHHAQLHTPGFVTASETATVSPENADTVRYLSDLWQNLCELQELIAKDPTE